MIRDIAALPRTGTAAATPEPAHRTAGPAPAMAGASAPMLPNPRLRIDAALNLVVLEFRDDAGEVSRTIPSAQEMKAYRDGTAEPATGPQPALDLKG